jgi:hypothetical protein
MDRPIAVSVCRLYVASHGPRHAACRNVSLVSRPSASHRPRILCRARGECGKELEWQCHWSNRQRGVQIEKRLVRLRRIMSHEDAL